MIELRSTLAEYSSTEFKALIAELIEAQGSAAYQDRLLEHFIDVTEHTSGSDLIYHPTSGQQETAEEILQRIVEWRTQQGSPVFKPE